MILKKGYDFDKDTSLYVKYGVYGKKVLYEKECIVNEKTELVTRQRIINKY